MLPIPPAGRALALRSGLALLVLLAAAPGALAQPVSGTCAFGRAEAALDVGDVFAKVFNTGTLFFGNATTTGNGYVVPTGSGKSSVFASGLWVGGQVGGELRVAGATYGAFNFWTGPLDPATGRPVNPADCSAYDRIYSVSRADVAAYYATGEPTADLRDWPHALGAPVLDGDGVPGNYDLDGGDQPAIRGDQTVWWLMNDVGGPHTANATPPLGVEARVEAFALVRPPLGQTTLYRYTLTNRTAETVDSVYAAMFVDPDLGDTVDDYVGTDTTQEIGYVYNSDDEDGTGDGNTYGAAPPAAGFQVVEGPIGLPNGRDDDGDGVADEPGERLGLTSAMYFVSDASGGPTTDPDTGRERYFFMQGLWGDGAPMRSLGSGYGETGGEVTTFAFSGDPVTNRAWSEPNPGAGFSPMSPGERRYMVSTGPFRLGPGEGQTVTFAIPFGRGTSNLDSVTRLRGVATAVRAVFLVGAFDPVRVDRPASGPPDPEDQQVSVSRPFPNPFTGAASVVVRAPSGTPLRATLHDVLGRVVAVLHDGPTEGPETRLGVDGADLASGLYRVRVAVPAGERTVTLVRAR